MPTPSGIRVDGAILDTVCDDVVHPKKKKPSISVDGNIKMMPAVFSLDFSAISVRKVMKMPPAKNEMKVCSSMELFKKTSFRCFIIFFF